MACPCLHGVFLRVESTDPPDLFQQFFPFCLPTKNLISDRKSHMVPWGKQT